jgi:adenylate cyclase
MERRLAAIIAADVAGYSRLVGLDETGTFGLLRSTDV